ncbi:hypothetical protein [Vibrio owensii]|uniref:hypothetical protein n=1 Tax=Vibrio owensii TaxID=696485 RepID=UPI003919AD9F
MLNIQADFIKLWRLTGIDPYHALLIHHGVPVFDAHFQQGWVIEQRQRRIHWCVTHP